MLSTGASHFFTGCLKQLHTSGVTKVGLHFGTAAQNIFIGSSLKIAVAVCVNTIFSLAVFFMQPPIKICDTLAVYVKEPLV